LKLTSQNETFFDKLEGLLRKMNPFANLPKDVIIYKVLPEIQRPLLEEIAYLEERWKSCTDTIKKLGKALYGDNILCRWCNNEMRKKDEYWEEGKIIATRKCDCPDYENDVCEEHSFPCRECARICCALCEESCRICRIPVEICFDCSKNHHCEGKDAIVSESSENESEA
jgi:hypothetical protein